MRVLEVQVIPIKLVPVSDIFTCYECHENTQRILAAVGGDVETREASQQVLVIVADTGLICEEGKSH